jgi:hypothetical protein
MGRFNIKDRIERNATVWLLGTLLTGFLSGVGVYRAIQDMAGLSLVPAGELEGSKRRIAELERTVAESEGRAAAIAAQAKLAYQPIRSRRVRVVHNPPDLQSALKIQDRLSNWGANVTLHEWRSEIPHNMRKVVHTEDSSEAALLIKRLVSDVTSMSLEQDNTLRAENLDIVLWVLFK